MGLESRDPGTSLIVALNMSLCYTYDMLQRTSLLLDGETRLAARQLALRYGCSTSEAIRRAVLCHRDSVFGVPAESRNERRKTLDRLFVVFEGNDAEEEIRRLKAQDPGF